MGLEVLRGRISHYRAERHFADFVITDQDRKGMGVLAVTAGLAGLSPANQWAMGAHVDGRSRNGMLALRIIHTQRVPNTAKSATTIQSPRIPRNSGPVFKRVRVSTRFWPDQAGDPQLVLPSDSGRIDTLNARASHYIARSEAARAEAQARATACHEAGRCSGDQILW